MFGLRVENGWKNSVSRRLQKCFLRPWAILWSFLEKLENTFQGEVTLTDILFVYCDSAVLDVISTRLDSNLMLQSMPFIPGDEMDNIHITRKQETENELIGELNEFSDVIKPNIPRVTLKDHKLDFLDKPSVRLKIRSIGV